MTLLIFYLSLALGVSFLCSIMEAVLLSISPSFAAQMEQEGTAIGRKLKFYKDNVDRPLAAILSLNTIAHTVGAAGVGAQAGVVFGNQYLGAVSAVLTFLILVLSEIIPKTLGAVYWRNLTPFVVRVLGPTMWTMWPLVKMAELLTKILARGEKVHAISRDEFLALAELGAREGIFHEGESQILKNFFRFRSVRVSDIMTPRTVAFAMPAAMTVEEVMKDHPQMRFSRIPVYGKDLDDIRGFVLKNEVLLAAARDEDNVTLGELQRPITPVQHDSPLSRLFEKLMDKREHIALVVGEYGGTAGFVTLEDLIETLLGLEIVDEADSVHDMQALAREEWKKRARKLGLIENSDETP